MSSNVEIPVKSVQAIAQASGLPDSLIDRHLDSLCEMALRCKALERKQCKSRIRAWYFNKEVNKPQLFEVLD